MAKNGLRGNNTRLIFGLKGDNPKLMAQALSDGRESLYLEYYLGYEEATSRTGKTYKKTLRRVERLGLFIEPGSSAKEHNREVLQLAKKIRFEREQQGRESATGFRLVSRVKIDLLAWMREYYHHYTKRDVKVVKCAINAFMDFQTDPGRELLPRKEWTPEQREAALKTRRERAERLRLYPNQFTPVMAARFVDYLQQRFSGEGALSVYKRFKTMISAAIKGGIIGVNPFADVKAPRIDRTTLKKEILTNDEIATLAATHYPRENAEIRRAFLFSCYAGVRWCDVVELSYRNVDYARGVLTFRQSKTDGHSSASGVTLPLSPTLLKLIGKPATPEEENGLIFDLPSHTDALKALRSWTKHAGISKHITWHCARHSFAVNILNSGANIKTVSDLLGHSSLRCTEVYLHTVDRLKADAINSLPELEI